MTPTRSTAASGGRVTLSDPASPDALLAALAVARADGVVPRVRSAAAWIGTPEVLTSLVDAGVAALVVPLASADEPARHVLRAAAARDHLHTVLAWTLTPAATGQGAAVAELAHALGVPIEVDAQVGLAHPQARDALDALWSTCLALGVAVRGDGLSVPPPVPGQTHHDPLPVGPAVVTAVRADLSLPSFLGGLSVGEGLDAAADLTRGVDQLGRLLAAVGMPVHELPRCQGGLGRGAGPRCGGCPGGAACGGAAVGEPHAPAVWEGVGAGATVHVVIPYLEDRIAVEATLPGLARRLTALGCQVVVHSAWHAPTNPHGPSLDGPPTLDDDGGDARHAHARQEQAAFVRALDLSGADAVVVPGWTWGDYLLRHRTLPAHARLVVVDDHLMSGVERWKQRWLPAGALSLHTSWWPDPRVHVHGCFPRYARLAWYAGVPLGQVWWRPYPMHLPSFPVGPDPRTCDHAFAGGNHLRDHELLAQALHLVPGGRPVVLCSHHRPRARADGLQFEAPVPLPAFHARLAASRFVVLPLRYVPDKAAGISVVAMAQAAGRPVIATCTPAMLDHVRHGVDGLLVPEGDAAALAAAIRRLDEDDDLLDHLAAGARQAAARADTATWAAGLVHGAPWQDVPGWGRDGSEVATVAR